MIKKIIALGLILSLTLILFSMPVKAVPTSYDLSTQSAFPIIGNQGNEGSCTAFALTYYDYGYMYAKQNNWTLGHTGNPAYLFSPSFTYNRQLWMSYESNADVILKDGVCTENYMPYNDNDDTYLGNASAIANALTHMELISYTHITHNTSQTDNIKALISNNIPVVFAIAVGNMNDRPVGCMVNNDMMADYYNTSYPINHAICIVGYDDSLNSGSFKCAQSYGTGYFDNGFFWIQYTCLYKIGVGADLMYLKLSQTPIIIPVGANVSYPITSPDVNFTSYLPIMTNQDARGEIGVLMIAGLFAILIIVSLKPKRGKK